VAVDLPVRELRPSAWGRSRTPMGEQRQSPRHHRNESPKDNLFLEHGLTHQRPNPRQCRGRHLQGPQCRMSVQQIPRQTRKRSSLPPGPMRGWKCIGSLLFRKPSSGRHTANSVCGCTRCARTMWGSKHVRRHVLSSKCHKSKSKFLSNFICGSTRAMKRHMLKHRNWCTAAMRTQ